MAVPFIHRLDDLDSSQVSVAGGKGASLGELLRAGVRVPRAFVIDRFAFDAFLAGADPDGHVNGWLADPHGGGCGGEEVVA